MWVIVNMAATYILGFLCLVPLLLVPGAAGTCEDLSTSACSLFLASKPDMCSDLTLANNCKRFCGLCPLECYVCAGAVNGSSDCNATSTCGQGEVCMIKTHSAPTGDKEYIMSCETQVTCEGLGFGFHNLVGRRDIDQSRAVAQSRAVVQSRERRDVSIHCCGVDLCNYPSDLTTTPLPVTNAPTTSPTTLPTTTLSPLHTCDRDIVFILDGSTTVGPYNHRLMVNFVSQLIKNIRIGPTHTQVAMVEYSDAARVEWYLSDHVTGNDLLHATSSVPFVSGSTATHAAFWLVRNSVFTSRHGDRSNAKNVVVIVTDGGTDVPGLALSEAKLLHDSGVEIIAIGVGTAVDQNELRQYTQPTGNTFTVNSFSTLAYIQGAVARLFCK